MRRASGLYSYTPRSYKREARDCCVRALAVAAPMPYEEAHAIFKASGRRDRRATPWVVADRAALSVGMIPVPIDQAAKPTLAKFVRAHPVGRYYLSRNTHAFALIDGVVYDWKESRTGSRSRIRRAWRMP